MNSNNMSIQEITEMDDLIYDSDDNHSEPVPPNTDPIPNDNVISDIEELSDTETLDKLINDLPENFPAALPMIREKIAPILGKLEGGVYDHYIQRLKTRTKAATKKAVQMEIEDVIRKMEMKDHSSGLTFVPSVEPDPEILARVEEIKHDPLAFRRRMDLVGALGVVGEKRAIGIHFITLDSRLIPKDGRKSEALAEKCSGPHGTGKSFPLRTCLLVYPESCYHLITNASSRSLYSVEGGLKHKALVLVEALALERNGNGDNELAYSVRTLVSEGDLHYQYSGYEDKKRSTIKITIPGPTSLLTTTVQGRLESQLEDRMITVHPDISNDQTRKILEISTMRASGELVQVDSKEIEAWKSFHRSLEPVDVVIPFAGKIVGHISGMRDLPTSIHRAFGRVLSAIKAVAIFHQFQRERDGHGRIVAEMQDYSIARQLISEPFMESIGMRNSYTDRRVKVVKRKGPISMKNLALIENVTVPTLTPWIKERVEKGILVWCSEDGQMFQDAASLEKAKRSGKAFIRVGHAGELPTPLELTGDRRWEKGGELSVMYDLGINENIPADAVIPEEDDEGVRVFDEKEGLENNSVLAEKTSQAAPNPLIIDEPLDLSKFKDFLAYKGQKEADELPEGILLI